MNFSFNCIKKDYIEISEDESRQTFAPIQRNFLTVPGLSGGYLQDTDVKPRPLNVKINVYYNDFPDLQRLKEDLSVWLITDEPAELIFDDEPDRIYYAVVDGSLDLDEMIRIGKGTITFVCPDPYKYSEELSPSITNPGSLIVEGSVETKPIIEVTLKEDVTYVAVSNDEKINMVGFPAKQEEEPIEAETPILLTSGETLVGWTDASEPSLEGFPLTGVMKVNDCFWTDDYGYYEANPAFWHGPAKKTSLSEALTDFELDVGFYIRQTLGQAGAIEVGLLDANSRMVTRLEITRHYPGINTLYPSVRVGTKDNGVWALQEKEFDPSKIFGINQLDWQGIMKVLRVGNKWTVYSFIYVNGQWVRLPMLDGSFNDDGGIASVPITQVMVRVFQRGEIPSVEQWIADVHIYRVNDLNENQMPIIGRVGDKVTFDHKNNNILLNGLPILDKKAFIGQYWSLKPGLNNLAVEPASAIESLKVRYQPKWR